MNSRERMLAIAVGVLVGAFGLWYVYDWIDKGLAKRRSDLASAKDMLDKQQFIVLKGQQASQKLAAFEKQSLPSNLERAQSLYQKWLLDLVQKHKVSESNVTAISGRTSKGIYHQFSFSVKGRARLDQVTRLLHDFYAVDRLHRIRRLRLKPVENSTDLSVDFLVEALALPTAPDAKELASAPSKRLAHGSADAYVKAITERNFFDGPHLPPRASTTAKREYIIGSPVAFTVRGEDPEKRGVTFALEKASFEGANLDEKNGTFTWKPEEKGDYELTVRVTDGGVPPKSATTTVKFAVVDPPAPKAPVEERKPPPFDTAKYTYLTAVIDVEGQQEAWLVVRTTGQTLKLGVGEKFDVGVLKGTVTQIGAQDIEVETSDGKRLLVGIGESLREALPLPVGDI